MFQFLCNEPGGTVVRSIKPLSRNADEVARIGRLVESVPNFLAEGMKLEDIVEQEGTAFFVVGDEFGIEDPVGLVCAGDIRQGDYAVVHVTFWDGRLRGRERFCKELMEWLAEMMQLKVVLTGIPADKTRVLRFAGKVGFRLVREQDGMVLLGYLPNGER